MGILSVSLIEPVPWRSTELYISILDFGLFSGEGVLALAVLEIKV